MRVMAYGKTHHSQELCWGLFTHCITSRTVHHCPCVPDTLAHIHSCCVNCNGCNCLWVSTDTPLIAWCRVPRLQQGLRYPSPRVQVARHAWYSFVCPGTSAWYL